MHVNRSGQAEDFRIRQRSLDFGLVHAWAITSSAMTYRRTPELIGQFDPEAYHVTLMLRGAQVIDDGTGQTVLTPHSLHAGSTSRPYRGCVADGHSLSTYFGVLVPRPLLPLPQRTADRAIGVPFSGREGVGALLSGVLTRLAVDADSYPTSGDPHLGAVLIDLMAALFACATEGERSLEPETHARTLTLRIQAFIQQHLDDPRLTPGAVAAAHHISLSYLHRLFQARGETVASWIRHQRLERARRDLSDPAQLFVPVHRIASRWGFGHAAAFSRAFRDAYGVPPMDFRKRRLSRGQNENR
ncbi:helix-turn-helix transcriptional regulator [Amycolatopsis coloradensis]|nr:AraC family transcriptional regulator [Amycolatopsis coloradensis]